MDTKIIKEINNPLFKRKEIILEVKTDIVPNYIDAKKLISKKFSTNPENILIKRIKGKFGKREFLIYTNIYESKEDKEATEHMSKKEKQKDQMPEEKPAEEPKPVEGAKAVETPKEEAKVKEKPIETPKSEDTKLEEEKKE